MSQPKQSEFLVTLKVARTKVAAVFAKRLGERQSSCQHLRIAHWDGSGISLSHPRRICLECGIEEEGGWWCYRTNCEHWHAKEGNTTRLNNTPDRNIVEVSFDTLMKLRV